MKHTPESLLQLLGGQGVAYTLYEHIPVFTVKEALAVTPGQPGMHIKNLFLKDKAGTLFLVTCEHERRVDLKKLGKHLGCKDRLSFANEETLWDVLGVKPGSVTPLALVNAAPGQVRFFMDADVRTAEIVNPHPLINSMTVGLAPADMVKLIEDWGHQIGWLEMVNFERQEVAA